MNRAAGRYGGPCRPPRGRLTDEQDAAVRLATAYAIDGPADTSAADEIALTASPAS